MGTKREPDAPWERYRQCAEEIKAKALTAISDDVRREMRVIAQQYEMLAADALAGRYKR